MNVTQKLNRIGSPVRRVILSVTVVVCAAAAAVVAEQVAVRRPTADVLDRKGSAGDVIELVPKDANLEVLGREGPWLHVRTASGKVGYVSKGVLVAGSEQATPAGVTGNAAGSIEARAAGKGFDPEVESYISEKNLKRQGLERMEALRAANRGKPLRAFIQQGHLNKTQ